MVKNSSSQKGSAHVIIIVVLIVALVGTLGFIFWQNFIDKKPSVSSDGNKSQTSVDISDKTDPDLESQLYEDQTLSFKYPQDWTVTDEVKDEFPFWTLRSKDSSIEVTVSAYGDNSEQTYQQKVDQLKNTDGVSEVKEAQLAGKNGVTYLDSRDTRYHYNARIYLDKGPIYSISAPTGDTSKQTFDLLTESLKFKV